MRFRLSHSHQAGKAPHCGLGFGASGLGYTAGAVAGATSQEQNPHTLTSEHGTLAES